MLDVQSISELRLDAASAMALHQGAIQRQNKRGVVKMISSTTLRPGLLVSLKTSTHGNVRYAKQVLESEYVTADGAEKARWETERTISDPAEFERAQKARSKARSAIAGACAYSAFGLLCPENNVENLERAVAEARRVADEFNSSANMTRLSVYVITGRIAPDDAEAVRAISSEVRDLMEQMEQGVKNLDVKSIRDAANRARQVGTMFSPQMEARIRVAIEAARGAARKIVKAGEEAAQEIDRVAIKRITEARTAFLDLGEATEIASPEFEGRAIDLVPETEIGTPKVRAAALEME